MLNPHRPFVPKEDLGMLRNYLAMLMHTYTPASHRHYSPAAEFEMLRHLQTERIYARSLRSSN
jgi:hypothetical protein